MIIQRTERSGELNISEVIFIVLQNTWFESSSLSTVNLDKKNLCSSRDIEFFLGGYFFMARPVYWHQTRMGEGAI